MDRKERILTHVQKTGDINDIARAEGVTTAYVQKICRAEGIQWNARRGSRSFTEMETVNKLHESIGRRLYFYRQVTNDFSEKELADKLRMSVTNLRRAESGLYEFKLVELQRLSMVLGVPLAELVAEEAPKVLVPTC